MNYSITRDKFLNQDELAMLKRLIAQYPSRDTVLIDLALHTGGRAQELLNIQQHDLNDEHETVFIKGSKGSKDREIPVPTYLYKELKAHIPFDISYRRLSQIWDLYKPVDKKFHSLRHTFAIELYKRTKDIKLVQICLGHKSITSTQVYAEFVYELNEMRRVLVKELTV